MYDVTTRLTVAYGLIALLLLAALAIVLWNVRNSRQRRDERNRERLAKSYRRRDEAAAAQRSATDR